MGEDNGRLLSEPLIVGGGGGGGDHESALHSSNDAPISEGSLPVGDCNDADAAAGGMKRIASSQQPQKKISAFVLAVIIFFNASGGPFGIEPTLKAAGNLYAIIGVCVMPFIWSLPEALITYEMSSRFPCASGGVRWTEEAFGETWGLLVGYLGWISGVTNNASYPVLFLSYVHRQFFPTVTTTDNIFLHYIILACISIVLAFVNYRGLDVVGKASVLIFFVSMAPFLLMVIIGIPKVDPSRWLETPTGDVEVFDDDSLDQNGWFPAAYIAGIAFRPFVNTLYWNFNGFDQASHYSNTIVSKKAYRHGIFGSVFMTASAYILPMLIATGATNIQQDEWKEGSFAIAATQIAGQWLGNWVVVSAGISLLASFFSEMSADSMQLQGMADRGQIPSVFGHRSRHDTPTYSLLIGLAVILLLVPFPFGFIIELSNFSFCVALSVEYMAFAELMIRKGDSTKIRKCLYSIMLILPMLLNIFVLFLASYATYIYGACLTAFGILLINAKRLNSFACYSCYKRGESSRSGADDEERIPAIVV